MQKELGEAELEILCKFLQETTTSLLAVNKDLLNRELHTEETLELLKSFAMDNSLRSLVVAKIEKPQADASVDGEATGDSTQDVSMSDAQSSMRVDGHISISFSTQVEYLGPTAQTIAFLKREDYAKLDLNVGIAPADSASANPADERVDLGSQIQVVNLGYLGQDSNIFELAATYVDFSFMPLFKDYKQKTQVANTGGQESQGAAGGLDGIIKGLNILKGHLSQARENMEIPMVKLNIDPEVQAKFDQAAKNGTSVNVSDFDDKVQNNPEFLNRLHNLVQAWYKEIRKVTTLDHNIEKGTASQEINFWAQMERSLRFIKEQQVRNEVKVTLDLLM